MNFHEQARAVFGARTTKEQNIRTLCAKLYLCFSKRASGPPLKDIYFDNEMKQTRGTGADVFIQTDENTAGGKSVKCHAE